MEEGAHDEHLAERDVDGEVGQRAADDGEALVLVQRPLLLQDEDRVLDGLGRRRLDEGELARVGQPHRDHLQDEVVERDALDLGRRVGRQRVVLRVGVEPGARFNTLLKMS